MYNMTLDQLWLTVVAVKRYSLTSPCAAEKWAVGYW